MLDELQAGLQEIMAGGSRNRGSLDIPSRKTTPPEDEPPINKAENLPEKDPALEGDRPTNVDLQTSHADDFEANTSQPSRMSPKEIADTDVDLLDDKLMRKLSSTADGSLTKGDNTDFIGGFIDRLPASEKAQYLQDGQLTKQGEERIRNALFSKVFADTPEGSKYVRDLAESTDDIASNTSKAIERVTPQLAVFKRRIKDGEIDPQYDIAGDL